MSKKAKFKPEISRIKLNPEQAVLTNRCYNVAHHSRHVSGTHRFGGFIHNGACQAGVKNTYGVFNNCTLGGGAADAWTVAGGAVNS